MTGKSFFEESKEQSAVKSAIVSKYFWAWANVISRSTRNDRIAYLDLFAGPGRYDDQTKSTPLLILEQAIENPRMARMLVTIFNDKIEEYTRSLQQAIDELPGIDRLKYKPIVMNQEVGTEMVAQFKKMRFVPTLFFVDPWGYKGLSLQLVNAVVKDWACECLFFFNYNRVNMGLGNDAVRPHMEALFGPERADELRAKIEKVPPVDREVAIVEALSEALNPEDNRFVLPFRFRTAGGARTSHHLIFVSKHFLGYHIMKGVMAKESSLHEQGVASFEYNAADARFPMLFELNRPLDDLRQMLIDEFAGRTVSFKSLYETHSVGLPFTDSNYRAVLKAMETDGLLAAAKPGGKKRRKGTFPEDVLITFEPKEN